MKSFRWLVGLFLILSMAGLSVSAQDAAQPTTVTLVGTLQTAAGCDGDWQADCAVTAMTYDAEDGLWSVTLDLPAGTYDYQFALDGTLDTVIGQGGAVGAAPIALTLDDDTSVRFLFDADTGWATDTVNGFVANVPGSYQSEVGCADDWAPWCLATLLEDVDGDGIYTYSTSVIPPGYYEAKVAYDETWSLNYGDGGAQNGANIGFTVREDGQETVFSYDPTTHLMTITVGGETGPAVGNLYLSRGIWLTNDTFVWDIPRVPRATYRLHASPDAALTLAADGVEGGESVVLTVDRAGLTDEQLRDNPQLADATVLRVAPEDVDTVRNWVGDQLALSVRFNNDSQLGDATSVQIWGVLDDLYAYDGPLGVTWADGVPTVSVWAPTARSVRLQVFDDGHTGDAVQLVDMERDPATGVWSTTGTTDWLGKYYLYEVNVFAPAEGAVVTNLVTDPYSFSLSANSERSQFIDLSDPALFPDGWAERERPPLDAPEDAVIYELHIRDFSIYDDSVSPENRGTYRAFTEDSDGMRHLRELAAAGLTHVHLLPAFDYATTNEIRAEQATVDRATLESLPPDSDQQQALVGAIREEDGFNWGYDPLHYTAPEGGYSTDPEGAARVLEFREMVQALNNAGLRVVMDVVYNHTNAAGQDANAVLDRIVPGYYHRLNADGRVESSTCCANTATEHDMMRRLMVDSVTTWASQYGVEGFRFDLMGHHMVSDIVAVQDALSGLSLAEDGVDGPSVLLYGEGWNFGEVADNARGVNATQINMAGTGVGTFNDRLRDAARGGNPFGGWQEQGFVNGLFTYPNTVDERDPDVQLTTLLHFADQIRIGLAGNLADYTFEDASGAIVRGGDVDYNGQPAGYTLDPQENIVYVSAHDNETLFDAIQLKAPLDATMEDRIRMQMMAESLILFSQGIPFVHAGDEILRSKSMDRDSYNSGDWFNAIDWTLEDNGWGHGLPMEDKNGDRWTIMQPLLADPALDPSHDDIAAANARFLELLSIRQSSPLFRLRTADDIFARLSFLNTGVDQIPGVIVMRLSDTVGADLDPNASELIMIFNASDETVEFSDAGFVGSAYALHPVQAASVDPRLSEAVFDTSSGTFFVPAMTTAVFVAPQG